MKIGIIQYDRTQRGSMVRKLVKLNFPNAEITMINLRHSVPDFWNPKKNTKASYEKGPLGDEKFAAYWPKLSAVYDGFVCIDSALAHYLLPERDRAGIRDTNKLSGMIVDGSGAGFEAPTNTPVLFLMDPLLTYGRGYKEEQRAQKTWQCAFHIKKLWRRVNGIKTQERETRFILPKTRKDLLHLERFAAECSLLAVDIETTGNRMSCIGFAGLHPDLPYTVAFTIPFFHNMPEGDGLYWKDGPTTEFALAVTKRMLDNPAPKCYHNGSFDQSFQFKWHMPSNNYIFDTQHMLHATWPSIDKALFKGAAMFLDGYRYWKDDAKDPTMDDKTKKHYMPTSTEGHFYYWQYNGLDCSNTLELCLAMLNLWFETDEAAVRYPAYAAGYNHAWLNYVREFSLQSGPAMYMSMTGMKASREIQQALGDKLRKQAVVEEEKLHRLVSDPHLNAQSYRHLQTLYYDILQMPPNRRKGRTTDKQIVQAAADKHPLFNTVVQAVSAAKEPANNAAKYAELPLLGGNRLMYQVKMGTTVTTRAASSQHNFKVGTNGQNFPKPMRVFAGADAGEIMVSADYSQSDSYFVAFESGDRVMIETVLDDRDTHSVHVEFFFGNPYDDVVAGAAAKAAWVVDPVTGVRQIIKKVTHGTNYDMGGETMLINVRKEAAVAMIKALSTTSHANGLMKAAGVVSLSAPAQWTTKQLEQACGFTQSLYYKRYPDLAKWKKASVLQASVEFGLIPMFGGSTAVMLGKPEKNPRFVPAAYGQGGTAGNINNAMLRLFYLNPKMWDAGFRLTHQIHDELVAGVPEHRLDLVRDMVSIMEAPCTIKGRTFVVPVEADLSYVWSEKYSVSYDSGKIATDMLEGAKAQRSRLFKELNLAH